MRGRLALGAFVAGAASLHQLARLPERDSLLLMGLVCVLALVAWAWLDKRRRWVVLLLLGAAALAGFAQSGWRAHLRLDDRLACVHRDHVMRLTVRVMGLPSGDDKSRRFDVQVLGHDAYSGTLGYRNPDGYVPTRASGCSATGKEPGSRPVGVPANIRVTWRTSFGSHASLPEVVPGQIWRMAIRLRAPRATRNPHGPDIEGRWFAQGVRALGTVQGVPTLRADDPWAGWATALGRSRYVLRAAAYRALENKQYAPVLVALALGDQSGMTRADWTMFSRAGIAHLVAISGLHVGLVAGLAAWGAAQVYRRVRVRGRLATQLLPAQIVMALTAWLAAAVYCSLAGWGIPAQRVFVMLSAVALAIIWRVPVSPSRTLMAAAAVIVVIDPWAPLAMGFWLSFAAVGALMLMVAHVPGGADREVPRATGEDVVEQAPRSPQDAAQESKAHGVQQSIAHRAKGGSAAPAAALSITAQCRLLWEGGGSRPPVPASSPDDLLYIEDVPPDRNVLLRELMQAIAARSKQWLFTAARMQWLLTLALAPMLAMTIGQVSLVSPLVNAFAIPILGVLVTPLMLACVALAGLGVLGVPGAVLVAQGLGAAAHALAAPALDVARVLSTPAWAVWPVASAPWPYAVLALSCVVWALMPPGAPGRRLAWLGMLPLLFWRPPAIPLGAWDVVALDVGQAGAAVVMTRDHLIVVDTGLRFESGEDSGSRTIVPFMHAMGRATVDSLVVSHAHLDHVGGVRGLMSGATVLRSFSPFDLNRHLAREASMLHGGQPARGWPLTSGPCEAGQAWEVDGVTFSFAHPSADRRYTPAQANASSCVLLVQGAHHTAVLPGDIGAAQERAIAAAIGKVDVVLAAHHGSSTSSSAQWVRTLSPDHVIAQSAYGSRFGHPAAQVQQRWVDSGASFWRNDLDGAVWVSSRADGLDVRAWRDQSVRYWHEPLTMQGADICAAT